MGYFSNKTIDYVLYTHDYSYTSPKQQLLWRYDALQDRLKELTVKQRTCSDGTCFSQDELRYVLPEHFMTTADVREAIELAVAELEDRYGICLREEVAEEPVQDEITGMQISFLDILAMHPLPDPAKVA